MKYKEGDTVICLPNITNGGSGYIDGLIFTIKSISVYDNNGGDVLWPVKIIGHNGNGILSRAVVLYNQEPNYEIY
jgi:hypothetical protein